MFKATQPAFERHCPKDRRNFLSYSYCLYSKRPLKSACPSVQTDLTLILPIPSSRPYTEFLEILGMDSMLDKFVLLKGRDSKQRTPFEHYPRAPTRTH